jgi:two-component system chemotaxis sensor kinase CheA
MNSGRQFFEQFIDDYFVECDEHLNSARKLMLQLEKPAPGETVDPGVIDDLLRDFHSIKGLSAMVGMEEVTQLSHHIEDYLREIKHPDADLNAGGISTMAAGVHMIEQVLNARRKSAQFPDIQPNLLALVNATEDARAKPQKTKARDLKISKRNGGTQGKWMFLFRPSAELAAKGITVNKIRERLGSFGEVTSASPLVLNDGSVAFEFALATSEAESGFADLASQGVTYTELTETPEVSVTKERAPAVTAVTPTSNVVRVDMNRLDDLMRIVGELVITRSHLDQTLQLTEKCLTTAGLRTLRDINSVIERQVRDLRQTVIRTRMVPISQIFERMRFVVRGLERDTNKKVNVEITGQDTELDKIIVDRMMDPLLHLVRNAVSHGIEMPDRRIASGKKPEGTLRLSAATAGDTVLVEIEDDGQGVDTDRVAERARKLGILGPNETLDSRKLLDVICAPGFTTRDSADLSSGRGVGMAAVMSAIRELGGLITLQTAAGQGTRFAAHLPLTLAITDALLVTVERQQFAVPQAVVREVFAVDASAITEFENNEVLSYRNGVLPIIRLSKIFGLKPHPRKRIHILVTGIESSAVGIAVDRITGRREVVVRAVSDPMLRIPGVAGATELGDGRPVIILDILAVLQLQGRRQDVVGKAQ